MGGADDEHAGVGGDRARLVPHEADVGVGQPAQHFVGPDEVQRGETRIDDDGDLCHANVFLYWSGDTPTRRMKLRSMVSAVPHPHRAAIVSTVSSVGPSWRRAASVRTRST